MNFAAMQASGFDGTRLYHRVVATDHETCMASPHQHEGTLSSGRAFYFRYRWGYATLAIGDTLGEVVGVTDGRHPNVAVAGTQIGDSLDGYLNTSEYMNVFEGLLKKIDAAH